MQEEEVPVWWWPVTTLAGSAGLIAVGTVIAWQELNATPQWGEWEILYSIDDSPRRTIMWGDIHNLIFRLKDAATSVGKTCTIDDYRLLRTRPEELIRVEQGLPRTHSPQVPIEELHFKSEEEMWSKGYID